jgi:hypothetical protein
LPALLVCPNLSGQKEEGLLGKLHRELIAKLPGILDRWVMILLERDQNLAVPAAIGDAVAEGEVDAGIRQSDIVEDGNFRSKA